MVEVGSIKRTLSIQRTRFITVVEAWIAALWNRLLVTVIFAVMIVAAITVPLLASASTRDVRPLIRIMTLGTRLRYIWHGGFAFSATIALPSALRMDDSGRALGATGLVSTMLTPKSCSRGATRLRMYSEATGAVFRLAQVILSAFLRWAGGVRVQVDVVKVRVGYIRWNVYRVRIVDKVVQFDDGGDIVGDSDWHLHFIRRTAVGAFKYNRLVSKWTGVVTQTSAFGFTRLSRSAIGHTVIVVAQAVWVDRTGN